VTKSVTHSIQALLKLRLNPFKCLKRKQSYIIENYGAHPHKGVDMFEKTIIDIWFDEDSFHQFLISVNDEGTLFLTERKPEVVG